ncbi:MAG: hypothetical protein H6811_10740 [Phycisphaeraceae bacterium]|nr:hypothetical protein [Phycisphaeraceae bacterium]
MRAGVAGGMTVALVLFAAGVSGCRVAENERSVGSDPHWTSAMGGVQAGLRDRPASAGVRLAPAPIDRSAWRTVAIQSPVDPTYHGPTYATQWGMARDARGRGDYPTPMSAIDRSNWSAVDGTRETGLALLAVAWDIVSVVPSAVWFEPVCACGQSPDGDADRLRRRGWVAGVLADAPELPTRPAIAAPSRPGLVRRTAIIGDDPGN